MKPMLLLPLALAADVPTGEFWTEAAKFGLIGLLLLLFVWWSRKDKETADTRWNELNKALLAAVAEQTQAQKEASQAQAQTALALERLTEELRRRNSA